MINNQEPRILIFSMTYLPFVGGAEIAVDEITKRINGMNFDLITARLDKKLSQQEKMGNVNVYRVGKGWILDKYLFPFLAYQRAKKLHRKKNYQIVQAIMAFWAGIAALLFKWRYPKVKYLLTMQSGDSDFFVWARTWFWYPVYKKIYTKADVIQVISQFLARRARKYGYRGRIEIVPNGVNLEKFGPDFDSSALKRQLGLENKKIILTVSRLVKKNAVDDLIKAGKYLDFDFTILIIGDGPERKSLESLTKKIGLDDKVRFLGHIEHSILREYISLADVFVRASLSEGFGNVFVEAMAVGVPVVATPVGGITDFLRDRENALFCQTGNPQDVATKIREILVDEQLWRHLSSGGLKTAATYNWPDIAQKMKKIYLGLINGER
jgi:glycosyltransferase involved in cell wall biosynthesis